MASRTASKAFDYIQRGFSVALVVLSISGATAGYMIHSERMSIAGEYEKRLAEYNVALANEKAADSVASALPTTNAPTPITPSPSS
ncbi:hypothetical protein [Phaffia rhodozyma]|uniref:Uncharacterized protein n=1 Tax=Phaffia rhodozyma TaxID=264483 RepID=A0A0F7SVI9_PHARH|nr:hypothetical protein [Phaffia rhodozyma]